MTVHANFRVIPQIFFGAFALFAFVRWSMVYGTYGVIASYIFTGVAVFLAWLCEEDE